MLIERLNILLPYQVRRLTEEDGDEIFALQRRHPEYHALFLNHKAEKADVLSDLTSIPEGVLPENKFYLGMYDVVGQGIGGKIIEMLKQALTGGQISMIEYFVEVSVVYQSKQNYLQLENQYQKAMAKIYKNQL